MYRVRNNLFPGGTAKTTNYIKLSFMSNESQLKVGYMSVIDNPWDDCELEN
jgi:hypothetical protein